MAPPAAVAPKYKAVFEQTTRRMKNGENVQILLRIEDPEDKELLELINKGERGYLMVSDGSTGALIMGTTTTAMVAQAAMRGCAKGTYNPFPPIKTSKRQELEAPRPVGGRTE